MKKAIIELDLEETQLLLLALSTALHIDTSEKTFFFTSEKNILQKVYDGLLSQIKTIEG